MVIQKYKKWKDPTRSLGQNIIPQKIRGKYTFADRRAQRVLQRVPNLYPPHLHLHLHPFSLQGLAPTVHPHNGAPIPMAQPIIKPLLHA